MVDLAIRETANVYNAAGSLDDEKFAMMSKNYTQEQKDLKAEVRSLQQEIEEQKRQADNLEQFIQRVKRNSDLTELTPYDLIGSIPVDVLQKAEQA